jgi:2-C-methyl-D-erythritol 2,4-cyclodiphosphate synthase
MIAFARFCGAPVLCEGAVENVKLTYADDFAKPIARCGFGVDTHAFGKEQNYIVLAGVKIPSHSGLIAHSDGDVLVHAVMDAMLSAAGLKDIGHYFPDTDEKWRGADSMQMLSEVLSLLQMQGYGIQNLSVAIQAEKPRLAKYIDDMKNNLANVLRIPMSAVGVAAGTNEGLGYVGEGKGITVNAYALLRAL